MTFRLFIVSKKYFGVSGAPLARFLTLTMGRMVIGTLTFMVQIVSNVNEREQIVTNVQVVPFRF